MFLLFIIHFTIICLLFKLSPFDATNGAKTVSTKSYMLLNQCHAFESHEPMLHLLSTRYTYACLFSYWIKILDG
jgi:hypothetical protein